MWRTLWLVLVALAACSSDETGGGGDGGGVLSTPVAFENYCAEYAKIGCAAAVQCDCLGSVGTDLCETYLRAECRGDVEEPVEAGRMSYDAALGGSCLAQIEAIVGDCSLDGDDYPAACDDMLIGQVTEGSACDEDAECVGALECSDDVCARMPMNGEPCLDFSCAEDHSCGEDELCHVDAPLGGSCANGVLCQDGYCNEQSFTCERDLAVGESCAHATWACDDDLYCSTATSTCAPYPSVGESCVDSSEVCVDDAYCGTDGTCHAQQGVGGTCSDDEECLSYDCVNSSCVEDAEPDCPFL